MDNVIFELRFLRKMTLSPAVNNVVDLNSPDMDTDLCGMDINMFQRKRDRLAVFRNRWTKTRLVSMCTAGIDRALFPWGLSKDAYQSITDEQVTVLMEMMNFFLVQCKSCEKKIGVYTYIKVLLQLFVALLASNKKLEFEGWIKEHLSEIISIRTDIGCSILHMVLRVKRGCFPKEPILRLFVEKGKMDVNVADIWRHTPLHKLSITARGQISFREQPTEDMMRIAELLINNGAHMDAVDIQGHEASSFFSKRFPRWSLNFTLKCLAARAILKHGIRYEKYAPKTTIPFIESHKPGSR